MKRIKMFTQVTAIVLCMALCFSIVPIAASASSLKQTNKETIPISETKKNEPSPYIIGEEKSKRGFNTKHFKMSDGTYTAVMYKDPVHKKVNEKWVDIDNTLQESIDSAGTKKINNTNGLYDVNFKTSASNKNMINIQVNGYSISWRLNDSESVNVEEADLYSDVYNNLKIAKSDEKIKAVEKTQRKVTYKDILKDINVEYTLLANKLKEDIVIKKRNDINSFSFTLQCDKLTPKLNKDKSIGLYDNKDNQVFVFDKPYMYDAKGNNSIDIGISIVKKAKDFILTIAPNREWLNDKSRIYPVTVDPSFQITRNYDSMDCGYIDLANPDSTFAGGATNKVGTQFLDGSYHINRSFVKFTRLPELTPNDMIIDASLEMYGAPKITVDEYGNPTFTDWDLSSYNYAMTAHQVTSSWDEYSLTWSNMSGNFDTTALDYSKVTNNNTIYNWDITKAVKNWYRQDDASNNYGIMLRYSDESSGNGIAELWGSNGPYDSLVPQLIVTYVNNVGLENYWSYHSHSAGEAGTGWVNDYTGNLVFQHTDIAMSGNRMPMAIAHVYNSKKYYKNFFPNDSDPSTPAGLNSGYGWQMNISQRIDVVTGDLAYSFPYKLTDADGTEHYFSLESTGVWKDEFDPSTKLTRPIEGGVEIYQIKDKNDNILKFTSNGYLKNVIDANGNTITYVYAGEYVTAIIDGAGRYTYISRNGDHISAITDPDNRVTTFSYTNGRLTSIQDSDGSTSYFAYDSNGILNKVTSADSYKIRYTYTLDDNASPQLTQIDELGVNDTDESDNGNSLQFDYTNPDATVVTDPGNDSSYATEDDNYYTSYNFDNYGRTIDVSDKFGNTNVYKYLNTADSSNNKLSGTASANKPVFNLLTNSGAENGSTDWYTPPTYTSTGSTDANVYNGTHSFMLSDGNYFARGYDYSEQFGRDLTMSCYIKTDGATSGTGARFSVQGYNQSGHNLSIESTQVYDSDPSRDVNGWVRVKVSFTLPTDTVAFWFFCLSATGGTTYFDCFQLEKGLVMNRFSLLENSSFENESSTLPSGWTGSSLNAAYDYLVSDSSVLENTKIDGTKAFKITGAVNTAKKLYQTVYVGGAQGDFYTLSGRAKANSVPTGFDNRLFALGAEVVYSDGSTGPDPIIIPFNSDNANWQYTSGTFSLKHPSNTSITPIYLRIYCIYSYNANTAYFDALQLVRDESNSYTYDTNGNAISTADKAKTESSFNYTNNNLNSMINPDGTSFTYSYDSKHNMVEARSSNDLRYAVTYDSYGNPTAASTSALQTARSIVNNTEYTITAVNSSWRVDIAGTGSAQDTNAANTVTNSQQSTNTQKWKAVYVSGAGDDSLYKLVSVNSATGRVLSAMFSSEGTIVKLYSYVGFSGQLWKFAKKADGTYRIIPSNALNKCLTEEKTIGTTPGQYIKIQTFSDAKTDDSNQKWRIDPVSQSYAKYFTNTAEYTTDGNYPSKTEDSLGNQTFYNYDSSNGLLKGVTDPRSNQKTYQYEQYNGTDTGKLDSVTAVTDSNTYTTRYDYTAEGRLSTIKPHSDSDSYRYQINYDTFGNVTNTLVGTQTLMTNTYKANNRGLDYNSFGNNYKVRYIYDEYNRVIESKYGTDLSNMTSRYKYTYDNEGNLYQHQDLSSNRSYTYSYDLAKRLTRVSGTNHEMRFKYDAYNRLADYFNIFGSTSYKTSYVYGSGASSSSQSGLIYGVKVNDTQKLTYTYDGLSRSSTRTLNGANNYVSTYSYVDGASNKTSTLLSSITNSGSTLSYTYDANGNIETISENGVLKTRYYYDSLNQLTRENNQYTGKTIFYSYDTGGNLRIKYEWAYFEAQYPSGPTTATLYYSYSDANWKDKLTYYNGQAITYDEIGNPLTYEDKTLYWQGRQLRAIEGSWGVSYYQYNDSGIRTQKGISGNVTNYYLNGDQVVREVSPYDTLDYFYDDNNNLFSFKLNGTEYYYIRNGQNDIIGILDTAGNQVVSYVYDTWGNILSITGSLASTVGAMNPYRYRGYRYDWDTGLYYLNSRYYNPQWGRFINADAFVTGELLGTNLFAYCNNNPVNNVDPSGYHCYYNTTPEEYFAAEVRSREYVNYYNAHPDEYRTYWSYMKTIDVPAYDPREYEALGYLTGEESTFSKLIREGTDKIERADAWCGYKFVLYFNQTGTEQLKIAGQAYYYGMAALCAPIPVGGPIAAGVLSASGIIFSSYIDFLNADNSGVKLELYFSRDNVFLQPWLTDR